MVVLEMKRMFLGKTTKTLIFVMIAFIIFGSVSEMIAGGGGVELPAICRFYGRASGFAGCCVYRRKPYVH